jgi:hypothetical protein
MHRFVDRDIMRYRGGAVGHKTMQEDTKCLLDDRDKLDKVPFELESEQSQEYRLGDDGEHDSDVDMEEEEEDSGTDSDGEMEEDASGEEDSDESDTSDDMAIDPSKGLVDDDLLDEMDEFGYSGLDQVEDENNEGGNNHLGEDELGAEDGENDIEGEDDFAHAYL